MKAHKENLKAKIISKIKPFLKEEMQAKLDENVRWTYISHPEHMEKSNVISAISYFIENKLDEFIDLCQDILPSFTQIDSESIGTEHPTEMAKKFIDLFDYLEKNGFPGATSFKKPVNFWSGEVARKKAFEAVHELSDSQVPSISIMFDVCRAIYKVQQTYDDFIILLTCSISRVFSSYAFNVANVYISSEKKSESAGITVSNNFWLAELPTLMKLHERQLLQDIQIHLYDHHREQWNNPVSLFSKEGYEIPVRRRNLHPLDSKELTDRFKTINMSKEEKERWANSQPRPNLTYGKLKIIAQIWRERTKQKRSKDTEFPNAKTSMSLV
ncbi:hypothetical protein FOG18_12595 [Legionella israelensis]|uniref:hypothetical protein n=1 Tax=Legionella israelensis TaxID=454 RepID=UPI0011809876|nr:hypothetical protein [Legionella israelensis]QDP73342.1 hypothetical protein FOG18_12595 [Legionella israelensis]